MMMLLLKSGLILSLGAQGEIRQDSTGPIVTTVATGEVEVSADRAVITIGIQFRDSSAAGAAERLGRATASVRDTLLALGFEGDSLLTVAFGVTPEHSYEGDRELLGYTANTAIDVPIADLSRIGSVIDAVLSAGANDITTIEYTTSALREARTEALRRAVLAARSDAAALAAADGGELGALVELSTGSGRSFGGVMRLEGVVVTGAAAAPSTVVTPRRVRVSVSVTGTWRFVPRP